MIRLQVEEQVNQDGQAAGQDEELNAGADELPTVLAMREGLIAERCNLCFQILLRLFWFFQSLRCIRAFCDRNRFWLRHLIPMNCITHVRSPFFSSFSSFCSFFCSFFFFFFASSARSAGVSRVPQVDFQKVNQATGICQSRTAS